MTFFPYVQNWTIPKSAFLCSLREMAEDGAAGNEGITLWLGKQRDGEAVITHLVALRGIGIIKSPRLLVIRSDLFNAVTDLTINLGVMLLGQIHSHGGTWVDLSPTDRKYGVAIPGYLSVVAPYYALKTNMTIQDCGVHIFQISDGYRRLSPPEVANMIKISNRGKVPMITIGEG